MESNAAEQEANRHDWNRPEEDTPSSNTVDEDESNAGHEKIRHRHGERGQSWTFKPQYGEDGGGEIHQGVL
jgi:hypothetical protein